MPEDSTAESAISTTHRCYRAWGNGLTTSGERAAERERMYEISNCRAQAHVGVTLAITATPRRARRLGARGPGRCRVRRAPARSCRAIRRPPRKALSRRGRRGRRRSRRGPVQPSGGPRRPRRRARSVGWGRRRTRRRPARRRICRPVCRRRGRPRPDGLRVHRRGRWRTPGAGDRMSPPTIRVALSEVTAIPLGNAMSPATCRTEPAGVARWTEPGVNSSSAIASKPTRLTYALPRPSTTMSFQPECPRSAWVTRVPSGSRRSSRPSGDDTITSRPSGSQAVHNGRDFTRAITSVSPARSTARTSPADQSEKYNRSPCQRGDSTSPRPVTSVRISFIRSLPRLGRHGAGASPS